MKEETSARLGRALKWLFEHASKVQFFARNEGVGIANVSITLDNGAVCSMQLQVLHPDNERKINTDKLLRDLTWLRTIYESVGEEN